MGLRELPLPTIETVAFEVCAELFAAYGLTVRPSRGDRGGAGQGLAVIDLVGDDVQGTLLVAPSVAALDRSNPIPGGSGEDWIGELANQLGGRLQNRIARCGLRVTIGIPVALYWGDEPCDEPSVDDDVVVWLEMERGGDLELSPSEASAEIAAEGELLFF